MKIFLSLPRLILAIALPVLFSPQAFAQSLPGKEDGLIKIFDEWSAFAVKSGSTLVCYIGGEPHKAVGKYKKRGDTFILVTHRPKEKSIGVISLKAGYTYKNGSEVEIIVGGFKQRLFTDSGHAWAYDAKADKALVRAMKGGSSLIAKGVSSRGTATTDTYSLKGFTAAYQAASKACGIK